MYNNISFNFLTASFILCGTYTFSQNNVSGLRIRIRVDIFRVLDRLVAHALKIRLLSRHNYADYDGSILYDGVSARG